MPDNDRPHWNPGGWAAKKAGCTCEGAVNRWGEGKVINVIVGPDSIESIQDERFRTSQWEGTITDFEINPSCPLHANPTHPSSDDLGGQGGPASG